MEGLQEQLASATTSNSKIIYRDTDPIHAFCLNSVSGFPFVDFSSVILNVFLQMNPTLLAAGLAREIIELNISSITSTNETFELSDDDNELTPTIPAQTPTTTFVSIPQ